MLHRFRFQLALEQLASTNWSRFEEFASAFLSSEFSDLRTVASPSGDEGRDAEIFSPDGEPFIILQYSVTPKWREKIRDTVRKMANNLPEAKQLIYVTNQKIGAESDALKRELRKNNGIALDIRDRSFFLDRFEGDNHRETVAANFSREIVDPYLERKDILEKKAQALTPGENRAALLFLELQWQDDTRDKGLTKTAFDALVRTVLRSTNLTSRLTRNQIHDAVQQLLHADDRDFVISETDKSLSRLTKHYIRHHTTIDEFCLTHEENERLKNRLSEVEINDRELLLEIRQTAELVMPETEIKAEGKLNSILSICRASMERFLLQRGEMFVLALKNGQLQSLEYKYVQDIVESELKLQKIRDEILVNRLSRIIEKILTSPSEAISKYLRNIADAYTFLAFLRQTPDVQSAVKKMFSVGEIWVDTSIALPLLAEDLLPEERWQFRRLILAAKDAGLKIKITPGVIEEVERHINRSLRCSTTAHQFWHGSYPYLFVSYISSGSAQSGFHNWLTIFRGNTRPEDDISDYLREFFNIETNDISADAEKSNQELRRVVKEAWTQIHDDRRNKNTDGFDPMLTLRLAEHDTENYVGVIVRRQHEQHEASSAFGYTSWWLTLDQMAFKVHEKIASRLTEKTPLSPVMSADFLANYLAFGPLRGKVAKGKNSVLPVAIDPALVEYLTPELIALANSIRTDSKDLPEHVIKRNVRDALDDARRRTGNITRNGLNANMDI